jgi:hypothetical protein
MSPVGGVGINYAIQDAVAAVNLLGTALISGTVTEADLRRVQSRREFPTRVIQFVQAQLQQRIVKQALRTNQEFKVPWYLRLPFASYFAARLLGYGLRSEKIKNQKSIMQIMDSENSHEHRLDRAVFLQSIDFPARSDRLAMNWDAKKRWATFCFRPNH